MKKFSLLFALLMLTCVSAMALNPQLSATPQNRLASAKPMKQACAVQGLQMPKSRELADINFEAETFSASYFESDKDWYCSLRSNEYVVRIDFITKDGAFAGEFDMKDCFAEYTFVSDIMDQEDIPFESIHIVTTGTDPTIGCEVTVDGVLQDGRNVHVHYRLREPEPPTDTVVVEPAMVLKAAFMSPLYDGLSGVAITDGKQGYVVGYEGTTGMYRLSAPTMVTDLAGNEVSALDRGTINVEIDANNLVTYDIELICENRICYLIHATYQLNVLGEQNITCHDMLIEDNFGFMYFIYGSTDDYLVQVLMFLPPAPGVPTDDIEISLKTKEQEVIYTLRVLSAEFVTMKDGSLGLDATFLATDMVIYTIHLDFRIPTPTDTFDLNSEEGELINLIEKYDVVQLMAYTDNNEAMLTIVLPMTEFKSGTYTEFSSRFKDFNYVELYPYDEIHRTHHEIYTCNLNIDIQGKKFHATGTVQAGVYMVNVDVTGDVDPIHGSDFDTPDEDVDAAFTSDDIHIYEQEEGYTYFSLINQERRDVVKLMIYCPVTHLVPGTYPINSTYNPYTVQAGVYLQQTMYPSYYALLADDDTPMVPVWMFNEGTVRFFYQDDAETQPAFEVNAINTWKRTVHVTFNLDKTALDNALSDHAVTKTFENGHLVVYQGGKRYDVTGMTIGE